MADVIARLKIDSNEYDSKIKRATQGLLQMEQECRKMGGTLAILDKDQLEFVKGLGQMETVSRSARGRIGELTSAFTDLSVQYKNLTNEEKKGDYGKALSASLEQLKGRINEAKGQLSEVGKELGNAKTESVDFSGGLEMLAGKLGISTTALTTWGAALAAVTVALKVGKDAFLSSETNVDEWGRTVAGAEATYDSFLQSLNTGDFSGFIQRIDEVIARARDAYNAMDELNTRMTILNPERSRIQSRMTELKATIRREGAGSEAGKKAQEELKALEPELKQAYKTEAKLNMNAFKTEVNKKLQEAGITLDKKSYEMLIRSFSEDKIYQGLRSGASGRAAHYEGGENGAGSLRWVADTRNTNQKLLDLFTDDWRKQYSTYLSASYGARGAAASAMLGNARYLRSGGGGGGTGAGGGGAANLWSMIPLADVGMVSTGRSLKDVKKDLAGAQADYENAGDAIGRAAAEAMVKKFQAEMEGMKNEGKGPFADAYSYDFEKDKEKTDEKKKEGKKESASLTKEIGNMASGIQSMVGGLESLGVELPEGLENLMGGLMSIVQILSSIGTIVSAIQTLKTAEIFKFWQNGGVVHAAGGFVVPGMYGYDAVPSMLQSGEVVLNRAQQGNLLAQMDGPRGGVVESQPYVRGEDIYLGFRNYLRRTGKGDLVTTRG